MGWDGMSRSWRLGQGRYKSVGICACDGFVGYLFQFRMGLVGDTSER